MYILWKQYSCNQELYGPTSVSIGFISYNNVIFGLFISPVTSVIVLLAILALAIWNYLDIIMSLSCLCLSLGYF